MKITFITPYLKINGGNRVITIYAKKLQQLGHDVLIVCQPLKKITLKQKIKSIIKTDFSFLDQNKTFSFVANLDIPYKILETNRPVIDSDVPDADVVVATWWETAEWVANLSSSKGAKAYFIQHHEIHDYLPKERVKATYKKPLHKITICEWLKNICEVEYSDGNVSLVPNSVDTKQFNSVHREKQNICTVGMLYSPVYWKGCDISLKAFEIAQEKLSDLLLVAFGAKKPNDDLPLPKNTTYFKQPLQNEIKNIYGQCDVWLFGSRTEGFGLPILEAMACRTPVIGTPAGAAPELISQGGGILVKPEDPEDMARAIIRIAQMSNDEWKLMSDKAYETATGYTWDDAAKLFEQALYRAIERTKKGEL